MCDPLVRFRGGSVHETHLSMLLKRIDNCCGCCGRGYLREVEVMARLTCASSKSSFLMIQGVAGQTCLAGIIFESISLLTFDLLIAS